MRLRKTRSLVFLIRWNLRAKKKKKIISRRIDTNNRTCTIITVMPIETAEERAKRWAEEAALRESAKKQFAEIPNHDEDFEWCLGLRMAVEELTTQESRSGYKHDEKKVSWTLEIPGNSWTASCRTRTFPSMRILHQS